MEQTTIKSHADKVIEHSKLNKLDNGTIMFNERSNECLKFQLNSFFAFLRLATRSRIRIWKKSWNCHDCASSFIIINPSGELRPSSSDSFTFLSILAAAAVDVLCEILIGVPADCVHILSTVGSMFHATSYEKRENRKRVKNALINSVLRVLSFARCTFDPAQLDIVGECSRERERRRKRKEWAEKVNVVQLCSLTEKYTQSVQFSSSSTYRVDSQFSAREGLSDVNLLHITRYGWPVNWFNCRWS